jgi:hypothetical protein
MCNLIIFFKIVLLREQETFGEEILFKKKIGKKDNLVYSVVQESQKGAVIQLFGPIFNHLIFQNESAKSYLFQRF